MARDSLLEQVLPRLTDRQIVALLRIAKNPRKGAYVIFRNPHNMIQLRREAAVRFSDEI